MLRGWKSEIVGITSNTRTNIRWHKLIETFLGKHTQIQLHANIQSARANLSIYHRDGSLLPLPGADHKFLQIYFMGDPLEIGQRSRFNTGIKR